MSYTGKLADPEFRRQRARAAARARHSIDSYIKSLVDRAPELTTEQRDRLAEIIAPGRTPETVASEQVV